MKELSLYVIHDVKTNVFEPPVAAENDAVVMRWFVRCIQGVPAMRDFPEDYRLLCTGKFNTDNGLVVGDQTLTHVCSALDCINANQSKFEALKDENTQVGDDSPVQPSSESGDST